VSTIDLSGVSKRFGASVALDGISLRVESGETVAINGASGAGKTVLLRLVAGVEDPSGGTIAIGGADMADVAPERRGIGMAFQNFALFPHMTVEKNVAFGPSVRGESKAEIARRLDEILEVVQLTPFRDRFPAQLSGGQMQRVAVARTLITKPSVLMMDEPLANLDTKLRLEMRRFIRDLQKSFGITTIFVTHDQIEAMELADRVAVIFDGHLAQFDTPERLYRCPRSLNVADFMGATNVYPGRLLSRNRVQTALGEIDCPHQNDRSVGDSVHVLLRAEALDMNPGPFASESPGLRGRVRTRDFFGASVMYRVVCNDQEIDVTENARRMLEVGDDVCLEIAPEHVWLLSR